MPRRRCPFSRHETCERTPGVLVDTNPGLQGWRIVRSGRMRAVARYLTLGGTAVLALAALLITLHYVQEVRSARRDTPALVAAALNGPGSELTLDDLTGEREAILLAVQDPMFRHHRGVDLATPGAGMTTITQGLVKLLYFPDGFHPGLAKIRQTLIAQYALDALVSKDDQLRLFLNITYFGHQDGRAVYGFADAARTYFGKEFSALTDDEYLQLVAMPVGPNAFKPGTDASRERVERIRRYLSGAYQPAGVLDVEYNGRERGSLAAEALMALLRLVTDASPDGVAGAQKGPAERGTS
jgi:membrane peptidoglycan carboxypeptidase